MKKILTFTLVAGIVVFSNYLHAQTKKFADTAGVYFEELKIVTRQNIGLWNYDLYAPILLVNPATREVFANFVDSARTLKSDGKIFTGTLPKSINVSNTSIKWNGLNWAMVMLPISQTRNNRLTLIIHELFHRAQSSLGFFPYNPANDHLDKRDGRVYLRLELEALKKAVTETSAQKTHQFIGDALAFRSLRHSIFPSSDSTENLLELNEGICEFTGVMMSGRSEKQLKDYFINRISHFIASLSYIRSFAYETTPVYGYLLSTKNKRWNKTVSNKTDLSNYFRNAFRVKFPEDIKEYVAAITPQYYGDSIIKEEIAREQKIAKQLATYKKMLIDSPHVELPLENMNMSFDYTRIVTLENHGTVYPQIRITDHWGLLEVEQGALISQSWNKVNIGFPYAITGNQINGEGWKLELKEGYFLEKELNGKNYVLNKK